MIYQFLKPIAAFIIRVSFRKIYINKKKILQQTGPLLIASNHPNSFLDAILLCILFDKPLHLLTRGDTFKKKWIAKILHSLHMLPVYRQREGSENLHRNYDTFNTCIDIFKKGGIVVIFSEALCVNEWHLRPLKKGTARLAALAWEQNIPLKILPVGLNYSNFSAPGKIVHVNFGDLITTDQEDSKTLNGLTKTIWQQLSRLVYEINGNDKTMLLQYFPASNTTVKKIVLFIPAAAGFLLHAPVYLPLLKFIYSKTHKTGHHDSLMVALFFFTYPFYLAGSMLAAYVLFKGWWWTLCIIVMPFCAWSYGQMKKI